MDTLTRTGVVIPATAGSDATTAFRLSARSLGNAFEAAGLLYADGLDSARPTFGTHGRIYFPSDLPGIAYYDTGSTWVTIGAGAPTDPAAGVGGLRTLGAGATQAAAGNHTHGDDITQLTVMGAL